VRSPEKVKKQLFEMEANLEREKRLMLDAEKQITRAEKQAATTAKILHELDSCVPNFIFSNLLLPGVALLQEAEVVQKEIAGKKSDLHKQRFELNRLEQKARELVAQEECLKKTKESIDEGLKRIDTTLKPKIRVSLFAS
jgi:hypothetical protein